MEIFELFLKHMYVLSTVRSYAIVQDSMEWLTAQLFLLVISTVIESLIHH